VALIPPSTVLGYAAPSVLMCLPSPAALSHETRQAAVAARQLFPLAIGLALAVAGASHLLVLGAVLLRSWLHALVPSAFDARDPLRVLVHVSSFSRVVGLLQCDAVFAGLI